MVPLPIQDHQYAEHPETSIHHSLTRDFRLFHELQCNHRHPELNLHLSQSVLPYGEVWRLAIFAIIKKDRPCPKD